jgi:hypothetical protein
LIIFNQQVNYALCKETNKSDSHGLKIIDMELLLEESKAKLTLLKEIDIGACGKITQETMSARIAFISS